MSSKRTTIFVKCMFAVTGTTFIILNVIGRKKDSVYENEPEQKNPMEGKKVIFVKDESDDENADGVRGHLEVVGNSEYCPGFYEKYIKRIIDIVISLIGLIVLWPVLLGFAIGIKLENPGPILFTQKRLGQNKKYFKLHKFRSMKVSAPHDIPTHMLNNSDQYITRIGHYMRQHSIDELPQIWDILIGNMSIIGPRPGLWNQDVLTAERDKYDANSIKPGLTGWAQINGRDELKITDKARLDGEYVKKIGIIMDIKCFFGSLGVFGGDSSVLEGGTSGMTRRNYIKGISDEELIGNIGFGELVQVNKGLKRRVLITGLGSYIGESFKSYAVEHYPTLEIEAIDMLDESWRNQDFSSYDIVYHVAGIAHTDISKVNDTIKEKYYIVNTDLAIEVCEKAKADGVKEFIFMSSMIVYGDSLPYRKKKIIDEHTVPKASNFYGDSKLQADVSVRCLADEKFKVIVLRPPMIYGKGSKGNYFILEKLAKKFPLFPNIDNERSMLYIDNFCEFLCQIMLVNEFKRDAIVLIPQNREWTKTSEMVKEIAKASGKKMILLNILKPIVLIGGKLPGKVGRMVDKAFGNNCYAHNISAYPDLAYQIISMKESIKRMKKTEQTEAIRLRPLDKGAMPYSVLMSVYNKDNPEHLKIAIESMLNQTIFPEQYVVVEDGPLSKEIEDIILFYKKRYPELFTVVKLKENGGLGNALNQGIKVCRNELIARMDADDISKPERCEKQLEYYKLHPTLGILGTQIEEFDGKTNNVVSLRIVPSDMQGIVKFAKRRSPFNHPTVMFRKSAIEKLNGYTLYSRKEDLDLFIRAVNQGIKSANLNEALLYYRLSEDNLNRRKTLINCKEYIEIMHGFYKKKYIGITDMIYIIVGQIILYIMPQSIVQKISLKMLRAKGYPNTKRDMEI